MFLPTLVVWSELETWRKQRQRSNGSDGWGIKVTAVATAAQLRSQVTKGGSLVAEEEAAGQLERMTSAGIGRQRN